MVAQHLTLTELGIDCYTSIDMLGKKFDFLSEKFLAVAVFFAVIVFGIIAGLTYIVITKATSPAHFAPIVFAETEEEYHAAAKEVMRPFFSQAEKMTAADVRAAAPEMRELVQKTQDRLLRMERIPKEAQVAHLSFVLLLGSWLRVLENSGAGADGLLTKTAEIRHEQLWVDVPAINTATNSAAAALNPTSVNSSP